MCEEKGRKDKKNVDLMYGGDRRLKEMRKSEIVGGEKEMNDGVLVKNLWSGG